MLIFCLTLFYECNKNFGNYCYVLRYEDGDANRNDDKFAHVGLKEKSIFANMLSHIMKFSYSII